MKNLMIAGWAAMLATGAAALAAQNGPTPNPAKGGEGKGSITTQKVTTFLMFTGKAEEAMKFYVSLFKDSKILSITRYGKEGPGAEGSVKHAIFALQGQQFMVTDSPPVHDFTFTPAMSLYVTCESGDEISGLFKQLSEGGKVFMPLDKYPFSERFGWFADKYGVSWQLNLVK